MSIRIYFRNIMFLAAATLTLGFGFTLSQPSAVAAEKTDASEKKIEPLEIPKGNADKLFEFLDNLVNEDKDFASEDEEQDYVMKVMVTQIAVAEKILGDKETTDEQAEKAAFTKLQGHINLAALGQPQGREQTLAALTDLTNDQRKSVAEFAKNNRQIVRMICLKALKDEEKDALMSDVLDELAARKYAQRALEKAQKLGEALEENGERERLTKYYGKLAEGMASTGNENLIRQAKRIEGQLRRFQLPGNFMEVEGVTLDGKKFNWDEYRGKVVLIDYWATWCGPCREELPNVKKNYKKYHNKGFEVVGISLDDDALILEDFLKDEKIPWVTLLDPDTHQRGWECPMAVKYGVSGIPLAILVDKEGKVVSMMAQGEELNRLLEELLGK